MRLDGSDVHLIDVDKKSLIHSVLKVSILKDNTVKKAN